MNELLDIITKAVKREEKTKPYDTSAKVTRIDGDTAWVHIDGGVAETPVKKTINAIEGDTVQVRVSGGTAFLVGNGTRPPTDDSTASHAVNIANTAQNDITVLNTVVAENIEATNAKFTTVEADTAKIHDLTADQLTATVGYIGDLTAEHIAADDIIADHETVGSLDANYAHISNGVIDNAKIGYADVDDLDAHYAEIDLANVNNAWIEYGAIKKAEVFDENVFDLSGDHATLSKIDASKINVANLRADNLVVRRINGQPVVGGYTLIDSNSSGYASKNPQALGWYEFVNAQWVLSTDTTVDMTKAYYQTGSEVSLYDQTYIDGLETNLQQQIDGAVETFTGSVVPTLVNWPYTDWYDTSTTPVTDTRAKHVGDIYYVINSSLDEDGYCYRFAYDNTTHAYSWVLIKDSDVTKALSDISDLQDFESTTTTWIEETDEGLETIRTNYTTLSGTVDKTVKESIQLWYTKANTTAPNKPTAEVTSTSTSGNAWRKVVPAWNASYPNYYYCWQYKFVDGTFDWSAVVRDIAMGETQGTARDAQTTANSNIKSSVQLWFTKANTTAPSKPTAQVTNSNATGSDSYNKWNLVVPIYNSSYPYYYYCYQQQKGDGTYQWSDVVYDQATSDSMKTAKEALPASTFTSFESTTFKDVKDTVTEHSTKFTNMTSRLGLNSDGTGANTDIVAKESALEQTVGGISTRVGKTETKLIGMYATSSTAAGTAAKVATITPALPSGATWELGTGTIITVKFTNANTTSAPTLNINSTGAKAIKTYSGGNLAEAEYKWKAGDTFTFTYNGTNWLMQDSSVSVRMNSNETSISQTADSIISLASNQSTYTKPDGTSATNAIASAITQNADNINLKVSKNDVINQINVSTEGALISANRVAIDGTATFNAIKSSADATYDSKGSASAVQTNLNNLEIGGRNLIPATKTWKSHNGSWTIASETYGDFSVITHTWASSIKDGGTWTSLESNYKIDIQPNTDYVLSFWAKADANGRKLRQHFYPNLCASCQSSTGQTSTAEDGNITVTLTTEWKRYWVKWHTKASISGGHNLIVGRAYEAGTYYLAGAKLEEGNKATDWTPAPEDVQAEIDAKKSVHTLSTSYSYSYANLLTYSAEGYNGGAWTVSSTSGVKVGDTVRLKCTVSNMSNAPVYVVGTVTEVVNSTSLKMTSHGLDTTVIDGGRILTNSIGANQIAANSIGAKHLTISDNTNLATANEIYESSLPPYSQPTAIDSGYLVKKDATQTYLMVTDFTPNRFKQSDELYYEFYGKAAVAGTVSLNAWGYTGTPQSVTNHASNTAGISLTTTEQFYSGTIKLSQANWNTSALYLLGFADSRDTKSQIYIKKLVIRRKNGGELIVDGAITADKIAANAITADKIAANAITIGDMDSATATKVNNGDSALTKVNYYNRACQVGNSSNTQTNYWRKFASYTETGANQDAYIIFDVSNNGDFGTNKKFGRLKAHLRTGGTVGTASNLVLEWITRGEGISLSDFVLAYKATSGTDVKVELWVRCPSSWGGFRFGMVEEGKRASIQTTQLWTLYDSWTADGSASITSGYTQVTSTDIDAARKTATDNITTIDSSGIWVTPSGLKPTNTSTGAGATGTRINSSGMQIFKGGVSVAEYGDTARVGKEGSGHTTIASTGMKVYGSNGTVELANIGYGDGKSSTGTTVAAPYYTLGTRNGSAAADIGNYSVAEGYNTKASGYASHAEGLSSIANGAQAHAEGGVVNGTSTTASGSSAHAEGGGTIASGSYSHSEGVRTQALGYESHAEGFETIARGASSHAGGEGTIAAGSAQTAIGTYNVEDTSSLLIVGNGSSDSARSNALTVDNSGNLRTKGSIYVGANADGTGGTMVGSCTQITLPYTPNTNGICLCLLRASSAGRAYVDLHNLLPTLIDGYQVAGGYINGAAFATKGQTISVASSSNMQDLAMYFVSLG